MKDGLTTGLMHTASLLVTDNLTVPHVSPIFKAFSDMPPVFASAYMVGFLEATCIECIRGHLDAGEQSVGIYFDLSHIAPTPVGMQVIAKVEFIEKEGGKLTFRVEARDEQDLIGSGIHKRAIIDKEKFIDRVQAKST